MISKVPDEIVRSSESLDSHIHHYNDMDMHRTTILLPEDLRASAEAHARGLGISLGELIRRQLGVVTKSKKKKKRSDDPLFRHYADVQPPSADDIEDGALNHDKYLAQAMEEEIRRWQ